MQQVRITIWQTMVVVGVVALLLATEPSLFRFAAEVVRSRDEKYIWGEAVAVWMMLNAVLLPVIGIPVLALWVRKIENAVRRESKR
jgi:hypothetical protein